MRWLVVLDPIDGLLPATDTSLAVIEAARKSGMEVETASIDRLFYDGGASVLASKSTGTEVQRLLRDYTLIFMRKEPPYDLAFHYATQLLSLGETLVVNSPSSLRNFNEKLIAFNFSHWMPRTLVSSNITLIMTFLAEHGGGVIKSLDSFQGRSVQKLAPGDRHVVVELTADGCQPVMVQQFLDRVYEGDKRVILLGDKLLGAILRRPKQGFHANFANSEALATRLTEREEKIVEEVGPWLVRQGIHFAGLDFIGEHLTEINITCPTGIVQISTLENRSLAHEIVGYFRKLTRR